MEDANISEENMQKLIILRYYWYLSISKGLSFVMFITYLIDNFNAFISFFPSQNRK